MKLLFTQTVCLLFVVSGLSAQTLDTLSIGAGYTQQMWYNFETNTKTKRTNMDWDLAFSTRISRDAAIQTNSFATLYKAVAPSSAWSTVTIDTNTLAAQYGLDSTWSIGAFNVTGDNVFNYGWGNYNTTTHHVNGDSVYVLKTIRGTWKKIIIDRLSYDTTYTFRYADLNGANEKSFTLRKKDFTGKMFGYFSFATDTTVDRDPLVKDWDIVATRYYSIAVGPGGIVQSYPVTGILQNDNVKVAKVIKRDTANDSHSDLKFLDRINVIGSDWKSFDLATNRWKLADSTAYFVKKANGKIYKLVFKGFGGSGTGNMIFTRENIVTSSLQDVINGTASLAVYPNPATDGNITIVYDLGKNVQRADFHLFNLTGQNVFSQKITAQEGLHQFVMPELGLTPGVYFAQIRFNDKAVTQKVIVK